MSKGSNQRPTDYDLYAEGYDRIFRRKQCSELTPEQLKEIEESIKRSQLAIEEGKERDSKWKLENGIIG